MNEKLKFMIAGVCVGFAELLPGISGSTVAIFFGIYEKLIKVLSEIKIRNFHLNFKKLNTIFSLDLVLPFIISMIISVLIFSNVILFLHNEFTEVFNIILGVIMLVGGYYLAKQNILKINLNITIYFLLGFLLSIMISFMPDSILNIGFLNLFFIGFVAFSFFLIPGISGSAILLIFGFYATIIEAITNFDLLVLMPFGFGALLSLLLMPKFISYLFKSHKNSIIVFFSGLIISSGIVTMVNI
tara:strand:- start:73 stop:801 length:729 start_codon:yes stop_codon:yes gene_type:complete